MENRLKFDSFSLQSILMTCFFFISIIPLISMSVTTYFKSKDIINANTSQYVEQMLQQTNNELDIKIKQINGNVSLIINPIVQKSLNKYLSEEIPYDTYKLLLEQINNFIIYSYNIRSSALFDREGKRIVSTYNPGDQLSPLLLQQVKKMDGKILWKYSGVDRGYSDPGITGFRAVRNIQGPTLAPIGVFSLTISESMVRESIENIRMGQTGNVIILDSGGTVISSIDRSWIGKQMEPAFIQKLSKHDIGSFSYPLAGTLSFVAFHRSAETGWGILGIVPYNEMTPGLSDVLRQNILLAIGWIVVSLLLAIVITKTISNPIRRLIQAMFKVQRGDLNDLRFSEYKNGNREIKILNNSFLQMTHRLRELIEQVYEKELSEKKAQLKALQAQINPHFLYNTLDTIYWMLYVKKDEETANLLVSLSNILRYSIEGSGPKVTMDQELAHIKDYLSLQSARFGKRMSYVINVEPGLEQAHVLKMIIQPILENAIFHGLETKEEHGQVIISISRIDGDINISIIDNGIGMPAEKQKLLLSGEEIQSSVGLQNVHRRLRLTYGPPYGISIRSRIGEGTEVILTFPYML